MVARVSTVAFEGIEARAVDVQVQVAPGLPAFSIVRPNNPYHVRKLSGCFKTACLNVEMSGWRLVRAGCGEFGRTPAGRQHYVDALG